MQPIAYRHAKIIGVFFSGPLRKAKVLIQCAANLK